MSDIFGRSTIKPADVIKKKQISSMIKRHLTSRLNLVDVDPGEIVVFETDKGKLKTSNISFDNILTRPEGVDDDSIAVFKQGKITAGDKLSSITNSVTQLRNEYNAHVANYATLRRNFNTTDNTIEKFFGKKNIKPDEVTITLPDLKKSIDDIKTITNKIKIPHDTSKIKGFPYVVVQKIDMEYRLDEGRSSGTIGQILHFETITGIYRISIFSEHQFNIEARITGDENTRFFSKGVNTALIALKNPPPPHIIENISPTGGNFYFQITPVDPTVVRTKYSYVLEYVSPI